MHQASPWESQEMPVGIPWQDAEPLEFTDQELWDEVCSWFVCVCVVSVYVVCMCVVCMGGLCVYVFCGLCVYARERCGGDVHWDNMHRVEVHAYTYTYTCIHKIYTCTCEYIHTHAHLHILHTPHTLPRNTQVGDELPVMWDVDASSGSGGPGGVVREGPDTFTVISRPPGGDDSSGARGVGVFAVCV